MSENVGGGHLASLVHMPRRIHVSQGGLPTQRKQCSCQDGGPASHVRLQQWIMVIMLRGSPVAVLIVLCGSQILGLLWSGVLG